MGFVLAGAGADRIGVKAACFESRSRSRRAMSASGPDGWDCRNAERASYVSARIAALKAACSAAAPASTGFVETCGAPDGPSDKVSPPSEPLM